LMTGASNLSMPLHGMISSKSSKNATGEDRQSSPASSQSTNGTYADAILDRLVHNAHRIDLTGHSLRLNRAKHAKKD
jgi:IstB-like ATP binding protein